MSNLHLTVIGSEPITTGRFGCDYAWNDDFTAYRCMPHRWHPSEAGYIAYQADCGDEGMDEEDPTYGPTEARFDSHAEACILALCVFFSWADGIPF